MPSFGSKGSLGWRVMSVVRMETGVCLILGAALVGLLAAPAAASGPAQCLSNHKYKASTSCTVPTGMKKVTIEVAGAAGGAGGVGAVYPGGSGGSGSIVEGTYKVSKGQVLEITVGRKGTKG